MRLRIRPVVDREGSWLAHSVIGVGFPLYTMGGFNVMEHCHICDGLALSAKLH
jgi:hypothetical protein